MSIASPAGASTVTSMTKRNGSERGPDSHIGCHLRHPIGVVEVVSWGRLGAKCWTTSGVSDCPLSTMQGSVGIGLRVVRK